METGTRYIRVEKLRGEPEAYRIGLPSGYARVAVHGGTGGIAVAGATQATVRTEPAARSRMRVLRACVGALQERGLYRDMPAFYAALAAVEHAYHCILEARATAVTAVNPAITCT